MMLGATSPSYKLVMNYSDIEECRQDCKNQGADLASVHSNEENDFIVSLLEESPTWIAGSITEEDGDFFWLDGSAWDFELWDEGSWSKLTHAMHCILIRQENQTRKSLVKHSMNVFS